MLRCCCRWLKVCLWFLCDNFCNSAAVNIFSTYLLSTYLCVCVYIYWYECMRYSWHYCCCYCQLTVVDDMYVANIWTRSSANKASAGNISKTKNRIINMAYFLNLYLLYRKRVIVRASIRPCMQSYLYLYIYVCVCVWGTITNCFVTLLLDFSHSFFIIYCAPATFITQYYERWVRDVSTISVNGYCQQSKVFINVNNQLKAIKNFNTFPFCSFFNFFKKSKWKTDQQRQQRQLQYELYVNTCTYW